MIVDAITSFLGTLIEQAMKPFRELLADTLLATPDVTRHADIKRLWTGSMAIAIGMYVLFVTGGGFTVMGYETVQTRYALKEIGPRLIVGIVAATTSLTVMGKAISLANALAHAVMGTDLSDAGQGLVERALPFALFGSAGVAIYLLLLAVVELVLIIAVLVGFIVRVALMALLAVAGPLVLACHAHPVTDPLARLWWRGLAGCLVIQVAQSMTFVLALKLFFAPGATALGVPKSDELGTLLAGLALFWVLFKIPGWTLQVVLRGTPIQQPHAPAPVRMLRHLAMYQMIGPYLPGGGARGRRGTRPSTGSSPGRRGGGGAPPGRGPRPAGPAGGGPGRPGPSGGGTGGRGPAAGSHGHASPAGGTPSVPGPSGSPASSAAGSPTPRASTPSPSSTTSTMPPPSASASSSGRSSHWTPPARSAPASRGHVLGDHPAPPVPAPARPTPTSPAPRNGSADPARTRRPPESPPPGRTPQPPARIPVEHTERFAPPPTGPARTRIRPVARPAQLRLPLETPRPPRTPRRRTP
ncbi:hypothetical protein DY218_02475 [Streptomyces triticagri]|uniref:Uncharacterized protein n=1 Tax=Streptomyces triticagri TaxID=2293568 RepID=A0A372MBG1_9ACTN|nr:hypothetical protein [Streptomyces triticagri]RFU88288.1 hypothetical protein DY218_02475 [Streptomyces triticagri]